MPDTNPLRREDPESLGDYRLLGRLGEGAQGVVYAGRGPDGAMVAIKLLHPRLSDTGMDGDRFLREVSAARRVAPFCTAQVLGAHMDGDRPYIVSELVEGVSLQRVVQSHGPRSGNVLHRLAVGTVTALAAIHRAGIVHRDFKPSNVLLGPDGPRVIDFGIARALDSAMTVTSGVVGTPAYMSPEQVSGHRVEPSSDMFSWGLTMTFAATGRPAFGQDSVPAVIYRVMNENPDLSALPDTLRPIVASCLSKDAGERPSASEVLFALLETQSDEASAVPLPPATPAVTPASATPPVAPAGSGTPPVVPPASATPPPAPAGVATPSVIPSASPSPAALASPSGGAVPPVSQPPADERPPAPETLWVRPSGETPEDGRPGAVPGRTPGDRPGDAPRGGPGAAPDASRRRSGVPGGPPPAATPFASPAGPARYPGNLTPVGRQPARPPVPPVPPAPSEGAYPPPPPQHPDLFGNALPAEPREPRERGKRRRRAVLVTGVLSGALTLAAAVLVAVPNMRDGLAPPGDPLVTRSALAGDGTRNPPPVPSPATASQTPSTQASQAPTPATQALTPAPTASLTTAPTPGPSEPPTPPATVVALDGQDGKTLKGHTKAVQSVAGIEIGNRPTVVSGSQDGSLGLWDPAKHKRLHRLRGHRGEVYAVATVSFGGKPYAVTGGYDHSVRLWSLKSRKSKALGHHPIAVFAAAAGTVNGSPLAVTGDGDGTLYFWNLKSRRLLKTISAHRNDINWLAFGKIGKRSVVVSASADETLGVWDLVTRKRYGKAYKAHSGPVFSVAVGKLGDRTVIASGGKDKKIRIWDPKTSKTIGKPLAGHGGNVYSLAFGKVDGRTVLVSGSTDGTVRLWDPAEGKPLGKPVKAHKGGVYSVGVMTVGDRTLAVSAGKDRAVKLWKLASAR
ncbi:protein kinase domain-containing protein [Streptosporangium sp. G11]|uniref:protein kinase domain-containing protein n=1 Tax=Streptosporangium sp. G11 TaxID=3436926 RepID=UPI003EBCA9CB